MGATVYYEDVVRLGTEMKYTPCDKDVGMLTYPLGGVLYTSISEWTPTLQQKEQLNAIEDPLVRGEGASSTTGTSRREENVEIRTRKTMLLAA